MACSRAPSPPPASACTRTEFDAFPYKPYAIQEQFMQAVYRALTQGGVAMVESPTGTGKTLSLICSALAWLEDQHKLQEVGLASMHSTDQNGQKADAKEEEPDWMQDFDKNREQKEQKKKEERRRVRLQAVEQRRLQGVRVREDTGKKHSKVFTLGKASSKVRQGVKLESKEQSVEAFGNGIDDDEFLAEDWDSDEEGFHKRKKKPAGQPSSDNESDDSKTEEEEEEEEEEPLKVFFCSRTHSQLTQFIGELQKTKFASSLRAVALGSRKNLCINEEVRHLGSASRINERCLDLQKNRDTLNKREKRGPKTKQPSSASTCPFKKQIGRFRDELAISAPLDIEDLVEVGKRLSVCPYYGSRSALAQADVVVLPYQSLLNSSTRDSLKVRLRGCVVILDEAHNLIDTVNAIHSCQLSAVQVATVHSQLQEYLAKFRTRLAPSNRRCIQQLLLIVEAFAEFLGRPSQEAMRMSEFEFRCGIDNQNLVRLSAFLQTTDVVHKISGYGEKQHMRELAARERGPSLDQATSRSAGVTALRALADFIAALTSADADGRIIMGDNGRANADGSENAGAASGLYLKFIMLNAARHFAEVVQEARAVVLAGGTLQPMAALREALFPHLPPNQLHVFSCGHIVPKESVLPIALARGPSGRLFDFSFQSRSTQEMVQELGRLLINLCSVVPEGVVCFFPSFAYLTEVWETWENVGILRTIKQKKVVYREPRSTAGVEEVLRQYRESTEEDGNEIVEAHCTVDARCSEGLRADGGAGGGDCEANRNLHDHYERVSGLPKMSDRIEGVGKGEQGSSAGFGTFGVGDFMGRKPKKKGGALLLCVVGGKMSEGINFSDGMGRCVIVVGMPYPNPSDPELVERMKYLDGLAVQGSSEADGKVDHFLVEGRSKGGSERLPKKHSGKADCQRADEEAQDLLLRPCGNRGRDYYENLCWKAVNQSIGRAIRHINDYAAILLVDSRYSAARNAYAGPQRAALKLPEWIRESLVVPSGGFGEVQRMLLHFFKRNEARMVNARNRGSGGAEGTCDSNVGM